VVIAGAVVTVMIVVGVTAAATAVALVGFVVIVGGASPSCRTCCVGSRSLAVQISIILEDRTVLVVTVVSL
jgi:hypothetical protein